MQASSSQKCHHCGVDITDTSTMVQRSGQTYCCPNCANAMQQSGGQSMGSSRL